jgi:hypothetical protein
MNNNFFNNYFIENLNRLIECPISQQIMKRPVTASDGITYDLDSIEKYFSIFPESQQVKSPVTREFLKNRNLIPNIGLKNLIEFIIVQGMLDLQDLKDYFEGNSKELFNVIKQKEINKNLEIFGIDDKYKNSFLESITIDYIENENDITKNILIKKSNNDLLLLSQIKFINKISITNFFDKTLDEEIKDLIENSINEEISYKINVTYDDSPDNILSYSIHDKSKSFYKTNYKLFVEKDEKNQLKLCQESKDKLIFEIKNKLINKYSLISNNKIYIDNELEPGYRYRLIEKLVEYNFSKEIITENKSEAKINILIENTGEVLINDDHILTIYFEDQYNLEDESLSKRTYEYYPLGPNDELKLLNVINEILNNNLSTSSNREFIITEPNLNSEYVKKLVNKKPNVTNIDNKELDVLLNLNKDDNESIKNILLDHIFSEKFCEFLKSDVENIEISETIEEISFDVIESDNKKDLLQKYSYENLLFVDSDYKESILEKIDQIKNDPNIFNDNLEITLTEKNIDKPIILIVEKKIKSNNNIVYETRNDNLDNDDILSLGIFFDELFKSFNTLETLILHIISLHNIFKP